LAGSTGCRVLYDESGSIKVDPIGAVREKESPGGAYRAFDHLPYHVLTTDFP
jgi:hypothetical protein